MKTVEEIKQYLYLDLFSKEHISKYEHNKNTTYYNSIFPETSFRLAALLQESLLDLTEWDSKFWIDDTLLTKVKFNTLYTEVFIWGVVIFGNDNDDSEWVAPLYSIISSKNIVFYFYDKDADNLVSYEEFNDNRGILDRDYYTTKEWNYKERNWKYHTSI